MRAALIGVAVALSVAVGAAQAQSKPQAAGAQKQKKAVATKSVARKPARPSEATRAGLSRVDDTLNLKSTVALVVNQDTDEVLFQKNAGAVLPIASITKLMAALVTVEAGLPLDEELEISREDLAIYKVRANLRPGMSMTRGQALHLALMSSQNHATHLLGRTYPGGMEAFVDAMNAKAQMLGMHDSRFVEPTGLSAGNRSSPGDLVRLVKAAHELETIREFSTSTGMDLPVGKRVVRFGSTNRLTASNEWEIGLQKTGTTSAAGHCLVMQAAIEGQRVVMVLLDSVGKYSRLADAQRIRTWLETHKFGAASPAPKPAASAKALDLM